MLLYAMIMYQFLGLIGMQNWGSKSSPSLLFQDFRVKLPAQFHMKFKVVKLELVTS